MQRDTPAREVVGRAVDVSGGRMPSRVGRREA